MTSRTGKRFFNVKKCLPDTGKHFLASGTVVPSRDEPYNVPLPLPAECLLLQKELLELCKVGR